MKSCTCMGTWQNPQHLFIFVLAILAIFIVVRAGCRVYDYLKKGGCL